jgi:hypothetical protein
MPTEPDGPPVPLLSRPGPPTRHREPAPSAWLELVDAARPIPLSASAKINNKEEVLELLQEAIDRLPTELREARWLRKQREEYLAKVRADGDDLVDAARAHRAAWCSAPRW